MTTAARISLQQGWTTALLDPEGFAGANPEGVYLADTRMLRRFRWRFEGRRAVLLLSTAVERREVVQHWSVKSGPSGQVIGVDRRFRLEQHACADRLVVTNRSDTPQVLELVLEVGADFQDAMALRGSFGVAGDPLGDVPAEWSNLGFTLERRAADGVLYRTTITFNIAPETPEAEPRWRLALQPGETRALVVDLSFHNDAAPPAGVLPTPEAWARRLGPPPADPLQRRAYAAAVDDVRSLLLPTEHGLYPAAGAPWFLVPFGRDALITAHMLVDLAPELARDVLRYLAAHQGREVDPAREEEPGKILHEVRPGELSRTGRLPYLRYYGSADATPLFVMLAGVYVEATGDRGEGERLLPAVDRAMAWMAGFLDQERGLITFDPSGTGLTVQSWKDSPSSMVHADGGRAEPPIAALEVQGYAAAAYDAAAALHRRLGSATKAGEHAQAAERLRNRLHAAFWRPERSTYAMAIDGEGRPLDVLSSNPGHLLWTGAVPEAVAAELVATLMSPALWSGWGLRTLAEGEAAYNPVSYHTGAVWPHDTAMFGLGLVRYGFLAEARRVPAALVDLAETQPGASLPEVISGLDRTIAPAPVAYLHYCRPQAWSAAGLISLLRAIADAEAAGRR